MQLSAIKMLASVVSYAVPMTVNLKIMLLLLPTLNSARHQDW